MGIDYDPPMELKTQHRLLQPLTRDIARRAAENLKTHKDLNQAVVEADQQLKVLVGNAESKEEMEFLGLTKQVMAGLFESLQKIPNAQTDPLAYQNWSDSRGWANAVAKPALQVALEAVAAGLPLGGPLTLFHASKAMVDAAVEQFAIDRNHAVPITKALQNGVGVYTISTDDLGATHGFKAMQNPQTPLPAVLAVAQETLNHAITDLPARPFHRTISEVALRELAHHEDREKFLNDSHRYLRTLEGRLPAEGPARLPSAYSPATPLEKVREHLGFYETLASL